ncbi:uncharacterized protein LOC114734184 [Neltuma alba]|uniref:uncharacterized protein LOC114734184 n=1 Tax=Neltuma alba TaxID=207710 RepID=UPI0010A33604|nr:uncharacterized protein LOC114734184 [Prosopis alba]
MEEYYYRRSQVPAFGSWDWNDNLPFTQCFESATQAGFFRCAFSDHSDDQDRDLYVTGDLYQNDVVTPAMIVVPRKRKTKVRGKGGAAAEEDREKEEQKYYWESEHEGEEALFMLIIIMFQGQPLSLWMKTCTQSPLNCFTKNIQRREG